MRSGSGSVLFFFLEIRHMKQGYRSSFLPLNYFVHFGRLTFDSHIWGSDMVTEASEIYLPDNNAQTHW